ncbi:MAG: beta-ketoacyl-ACP synthase 3 [Actinomycetota bacterium]|nr:beta-ketoacyl-ACP synthase 3 [Actinomycetota bacterium]
MPETSATVIIDERAAVSEPLALPSDLRRAAMLSIATELPSRRLTNAELAERLGVTEEWIFSRTGVQERPVAEADDLLSDFAAKAGEAALRSAEVDPSEVDLVIVGTLTQDQLTPNTAPLVANAIGAHRAGAVDVGAACTAFLSGLALGTAQIEAGRARCVLLIGADFVSRVTDYEDKRSAPLFGDGVGAAVLGVADGEHGLIGPIVLGSDGSQAQAIQIDHSNRLLRMDGPEVYRNAVTRMSEVTVAAVRSAGVTLADIDLFVYHQANGRITRALGERLGLDPRRVVDCIAGLGNSSAATLPLGLVAAQRDGRLRPGARVLLCAFGAGFTWGAGVIEWGGASGD